MKRLKLLLILMAMSLGAMSQGTTPPATQQAITPSWFRVNATDSNFYGRVGTNTWYRFPTWEKSNATFPKKTDINLQYVTDRGFKTTNPIYSTSKVYVGDSISNRYLVGYGTSFTEGFNMGSKYLGYLYKAADYWGAIPVDYGLSGRFAQQSPSGLPDSSFYYNRDKIPYSPNTNSILIAEPMVNDVINANTTFYNVNDFVNTMDSWLDTAITKRNWNPSRIVLYNPFYFNRNSEVRHAEYTNALDSIASSRGLKYLDTYDRMKLKQYSVGGYLGPDSLHATALGCDSAAMWLADFLSESFNKSSSSLVSTNSLIFGDQTLSGNSFVGKDFKVLRSFNQQGPLFEASGRFQIKNELILGANANFPGLNATSGSIKTGIIKGYGYNNQWTAGGLSTINILEYQANSTQNILNYGRVVPSTSTGGLTDHVWYTSPDPNSITTTRRMALYKDGGLQIGGTSTSQASGVFLRVGGLSLFDQKIQRSGNFTGPASGFNGAFMRFQSSTYTDSSSVAGTQIATATGVTFERSTFNTSNVVPGLTNAYSVYILGAPFAGANLTGGISNSYAFGVGQGYSHFNGGVSFGSASSAASLDRTRIKILGGTTAISPLEFTSGTLTTTPVAGSFEFLTDNPYFTISTGTARKEFTLNDATLNVGIVPITTTKGRLTNSAITSTQLGYLSGVTSAIQTQIDGKAATSSVALKQNLVTLTTTGSGAATFNQSTGALNIPTSSAAGTVTSITPGTGFTSATPITSSGTLNVDTAGVIAGKPFVNNALSLKAGLSGNTFSSTQKVSTAAGTSTILSGFTAENTTLGSNSLSVNLLNRSSAGGINGLRFYAPRVGGNPDGLLWQETLDGSSYTNFFKVKFNDLNIYNTSGNTATFRMPEAQASAVLTVPATGGVIATENIVNAKQNLVTLTTTGSGAATFTQSTGSLNIPTPISETFQTVTSRGNSTTLGLVIGGGVSIGGQTTIVGTPVNPNHAIRKRELDSVALLKQNTLTLTTTGTGAATLVGATLNIPTPSAGGSGTVTSFGKVDGVGITSSVATSTTTPVHTIAVDTTVIASKVALSNGLASKAPASGSTNYIRNQTGSSQTANFDITGNGYIRTSGTPTDFSAIQGSTITTTNGTNATALSPNQLAFYKGSFQGSLNGLLITTARNWSLPDATGTIALTSDLTQVVEITGTSQAANANTIYIPHNAALTTITAPSATTVGSLVQVVGEGAGGWRINFPAGYTAKGVGVTTSAGGSISSTDRYCTITLRLVAANTFVITSSQGTLSPL